jgi:hypothetical protein
MGIGVQFPAGANISLFFTVYILAVGPATLLLCVYNRLFVQPYSSYSDTDQSAGPPKCKELTQCLHTKVPNQAQG